MNRKQAEQALAKLDALPARNWRERQRKAQTADRLLAQEARYRRMIPEPYDESLPF